MAPPTGQNPEPIPPLTTAELAALAARAAAAGQTDAAVVLGALAAAVHEGTVWMRTLAEAVKPFLLGSLAELAGRIQSNGQNGNGNGLAAG